jgi:hypothetical protein
MPEYIASDDANPEFVGQRNPDNSLSVLFYRKPQKNNFESAEQGRPIFFDMDMVKIYLPGDDKNIIDTAVRDDHKERFPKQWAHYQNKLAGDQRLAGKTPIDQWPIVTPSMAEELRAIKFISVEDIANASDAQIQAIQMIAGMSPHAFRDRARNYLRVASGEAAETRTVAALAAANEETATLRAQMLVMQEQLAALAQRSSAPDGFAALAAKQDETEVKTPPLVKRAK